MTSKGVGIFLHEQVLDIVLDDSLQIEACLSSLACHNRVVHAPKFLILCLAVVIARGEKDHSESGLGWDVDRLNITADGQFGKGLSIRIPSGDSIIPCVKKDL